MTQIASSAAGNRWNLLYFLDTDGIPIGKTKTRPVAGSSTNGGPIRLLMPKSVTPTSRPAPNITIVTGEDGSVQHRYPFDADNTQVTTISLSAQDLATAGLVQNMPVQTLAGGRYGYLGIADVALPDVLFISQSRSIRVSDGALLWQAQINPRATLSYRGRDGFNERGAALYSYDLTPQPSGYEPWGYTIADSDGNQKQADTIVWDELEYPIALQAFTADGAEDEYGLDYQPVDAASTAAVLISQILGVRAAVAATISSVDTVYPYNATLSAVPTPTGRRGVFIYQFKG